MKTLKQNGMMLNPFWEQSSLSWFFQWICKLKPQCLNFQVDFEGWWFYVSLIIRGKNKWQMNIKSAEP